MEIKDLEAEIKNAPNNWGKWGEDEIGTLNYITQELVIDSLKNVKQGKIFTLGLPIGDKNGDIVSPVRMPTKHVMTQDESTYEVGKAEPLKGGLKFADDLVIMYLQGSTHIDALGHAWSGNKLYNGFEAKSNTDGLYRGSVEQLAKRSIIGRGVLLDVAEYKNKDYLPSGYQISLSDLIETAKFENVELRKNDILLIRTGSIKRYYEVGPKKYYANFNEPGITYTKKLVEWFNEMQIITYGSDTAGSEQTISTTTGTRSPLHIFLLKNLGIPIQELLWLEELSRDSKKDQQYSFLYVCSPLKFIGGTGSPVNPLAIK